MQLRFVLYLLFIGINFLFFTNNIHSKPISPYSFKDTLIVGIAGSEPFVIEKASKENPKGISIEIWEDIANKNKWNFKYKYFNTVNDALLEIDKGQLDVVAGPISITSERVANMQFSQPYYQSSLAIVSRIEKAGLWERVRPFFSLRLLVAVAIFMIILAIVGSLLWIAERKKSPDHFPKDPFHGIANGMWLAIVTMSTTGYGDIAPVTFRGRIIAAAWMIISIIFATSMVAGIASSLTLSGIGDATIRTIEQLHGKNVVTIIDSPSDVYLKENKIKDYLVAHLDEALDQVEDGQADAVVYDRPQLMYHLKNNEYPTLHMTVAQYYKQGYGFAFPYSSQIVKEVNTTLLDLSEDQSVERIIDFYLGKVQ